MPDDAINIKINMPRLIENANSKLERFYPIVIKLLKK